MAGKKPARNGLLLQTLKTKLVSIDAGGSQTALPQQMPAGSEDPNAIAPMPAFHKGRTQKRNIMSTLANCLSARPHEMQNY